MNYTYDMSARTAHKSKSLCIYIYSMRMNMSCKKKREHTKHITVEAFLMPAAATAV